METFFFFFKYAIFFPPVDVFVSYRYVFLWIVSGFRGVLWFNND